MIKIVLTKYEKLLDKYIDGDLNWVTLKRKKPYIEKYIQDGLFVEVVSDKLSHLGYIDINRTYSFIKNHIEQNSIKEIERKKFDTEKAKLEFEIKKEKTFVKRLKDKVAHAKKYLHRSHWSKKSWERYYSALKKRYPKSDWTIKDRVDHFYNLYKNNNGDSNKRTSPVQLSIPEWRSTLSKI